MIDVLDYSPWSFWADASEVARERQRAAQRYLTDRGVEFGDECFVSELAVVDTDSLRLGDRSYVAAGAYLTGTLACGRDCSINAYAVVRGRVELGDGVRVGAHTSILGFNHMMAPGLEVFRQPLTSRGISIGDDVWVGSHVVVLDGITIGSHAVLAAGAVVTKDVPEGAVVAGNPARFLRWRVAPAIETPATARLEQTLAAFAERARRQLPEMLERSWDASLALFVDRPGSTPTVRAQCDAIELSYLLTGAPPGQLSVDAQVGRLRGWQHPASGLVPSLGNGGHQLDDADPDDPDVAYHVLCVGYALDLLGSELPVPPHAYSDRTPGELVQWLDELPWSTDPWSAGHWVDALGTATLWARRRGESLDGTLETLLGWLTSRTDSATGMWGCATSEQGLRLVVNGFYRASRGTFAQFGVDVPNQQRVIDTVLEHVADERWFSPLAISACDLLDVVHPLWLTRASGWRSAEVQAAARRLLMDAIGSWTDGAGFAFVKERVQVDADASLQGTEMWLVIVWYLADVLGLSETLGYRPTGVHRPEPASILSGNPGAAPIV